MTSDMVVTDVYSIFHTWPNRKQANTELTDPSVFRERENKTKNNFLINQDSNKKKHFVSVCIECVLSGSHWRPVSRIRIWLEGKCPTKNRQTRKKRKNKYYKGPGKEDSTLMNDYYKKPIQRWVTPKMLYWAIGCTKPPGTYICHSRL